VAYYLDSSAVVKLVVEEPGSDELRALLASRPDAAVSCDLVRTEVLRASRRHSAAALQMARRVLETIEIVGLAAATYDRAGVIEPEELRSLDAVHLASALELHGDLDGIVTYDARLAGAAQRLGLPVLAPI
jgi:predicted nucleic acid-binding protein